MSVCSYCDRDASPTREHIIPSWFYRHDPSPDDVGFAERAKNKIVKSELVIKDVCSRCNGGPLSSLDNFGKELFNSHFSEFVFSDTERLFEFDYSLLARWLLKVSFNSARANGTDLEILSQFRKVILGLEEVPPGFSLWLKTIAPAAHAPNSVIQATQSSIAVDNPEWFRVGVFRPRTFDSMYWSFRQVTVNSYSFLLCVPDNSSEHSLRELETLRTAMAENGATEVPKSGAMNVPAPFTDAITFTMAHMSSFPLTYELAENDVLKFFANSGANDVANYWIDRKDIEEGNIANTLSFLADLVSSREAAMSMRDRLELSVHGYDDDPRELFEIPEVVDFLRKLDEAWPYWILFQHPQFQWMRLLAFCLAGTRKKEGGGLDVDVAKLVETLERWFVALNRLSHEFALTLAINKEASAKATRMLAPDPNA